MALVLTGVNALPPWFSSPNVSPVVPSSLVLHGSAGMLAALGWHSSQAAQWALAATSFLLIARVILRRDWPAAGMAGHPPPNGVPPPRRVLIPRAPPARLPGNHALLLC